jgi:hypothetical protein
MDEWIKKMWYMYTMCPYLDLKKGKPFICNNMNEPRKQVNEIRQAEKDK